MRKLNRHESTADNEECVNDGVDGVSDSIIEGVRRGDVVCSMTDYLKLLYISLMNDISVPYKNVIISDSDVIKTCLHV